MASIEKRRAQDGKLHYRVRIRRQGAPPISQTFTRLTDARAFATRIEADIASGRSIPGVAQRSHTLQEAVERFLDSPAHAAKSNNTRRQTVRCLNWWAQRLGHQRLRDLNLPTIVEYRDELLKTLKPNTVRGYVGWLRHLCNIAQGEWGWLEQSPFTRRVQPSSGPPRLRILSADERKRLLAACRERSPYLYMQVVLALSTGARQMELVRLKWSQVDFTRRMITFEETKTNQRRSVALASLAFDLLCEHAASPIRDPIWVFAPQHKTRDGAPVFNNWGWGRCKREAELQDFRFHDLRHTAASYLAMNGASLLDIAHILGHKSIAMTQRYAHLTTDHTSQVLESMNESMFGQTLDNQ